MFGHEGLIDLAGSKLFNDANPKQYGCYDWSTLGGAASILCRVGLRPSASSSLARQLVAGFMGVLSYVSADREQLYVSYSSDPILAIGATKLWHSEDPVMVGSYDEEQGRECNLSKMVLPYMRELLHKEGLEVGSVTTMVARIVLLLAMDACPLLESTCEEVEESMRWRGAARKLETSLRWLGAGEFYSIVTLLRAMEGTVADVLDGQTPLATVREALDVKWGGWFFSFTHFIELSHEPTEACLWGLLARRAAGILPRGGRGADSIIPVCRLQSTSESGESTTTEAVSMILVSVTDLEQVDTGLLTTVAERLDPQGVFSSLNPFSQVTASDVLRIVMSSMDRDSKRLYLADARHDGSYTLCILGVGPWSVALDSTQQPVKVVSPKVAAELQMILRTWGCLAEKVWADVDSLIEPCETKLMSAVRPLGEELVLNK